MRDGRLDSVNGIKISRYMEPSSNGRRQDF